MPYKIVPFPPSNDPGSTLQQIISTETVNGYRYVSHQYCDKLTPGSSGCFGFGAKPPGTVHVGFVVFTKEWLNETSSIILD